MCTDCVTTQREDWFAARPIDEEIVTLMRLGRDTSFADLVKYPLKGDHVEQFAQSSTTCMSITSPAN